MEAVIVRVVGFLITILPELISQANHGNPIALAGHWLSVGFRIKFCIKVDTLISSFSRSRLKRGIIALFLHPFYSYLCVMGTSAAV